MREKLTYSQLTLFQKLQFVHDVFTRIRPFLKKSKNRYFGLKNADVNELLKGCVFYQAMHFSQDPNQEHIMRSIYHKLHPVELVSLPKNLRCQSVIIHLFSQIFNGYSSTISEDKLLNTIETGLLRLKAINQIEASRLQSIYKYDPEKKSLLFHFQNQRYYCVLNPNSPFGFEMTFLGAPKKEASDHQNTDDRGFPVVY
jgi:hypothetical protein